MQPLTTVIIWDVEARTRARARGSRIWTGLADIITHATRHVSAPGSRVARVRTTRNCPKAASRGGTAGPGGSVTRKPSSCARRSASNMENAPERRAVALWIRVGKKKRRGGGRCCCRRRRRRRRLNDTARWRGRRSRSWSSLYSCWSSCWRRRRSATGVSGRRGTRRRRTWTGRPLPR